MRVLLESREIDGLVDRLVDWSSKRFGSQPLMLMGVLEGALFLLADVSRKMRSPVRISTVRANSYGDGMTSGNLHIDQGSLPDVGGHSVLLLDEICETGRTLQGLLAVFRDRGCVDIATAALLCKPGKARDGWRPDWVGFECPDQFVVGYGLDWAGEFRHLPHIACLEPGDEALGPRYLAERWVGRDEGA